MHLTADERDAFSTVIARAFGQLNYRRFVEARVIKRGSVTCDSCHRSDATVRVVFRTQDKKYYSLHYCSECYMDGLKSVHQYAEDVIKRLLMDKQIKIAVLGGSL